MLFDKRIDSREVHDDEEPPFVITWWDRYELLACAGCETLSVRHTSHFAPTLETTVTIYPPRTARMKPVWWDQLPKELARLLDEIYSALDLGSRRLALMGARAALDMLLVEKVGDVGGFRAKLKALERDGFIGLKNREILEAALDAGSAAAHRGYAPSSDDLNAVMDIIENLLQAVYHLEPLARRLKGTTPKRNVDQ
ncbi:MAG TPA: DUF4145 domain-containing protein [Vicinamibacterales bacterium]|nr:DUF4145 domain-containing protein [Vicinamibacterales bacterium]